ncbi:hypothetical protein CCMA1212_005029 [Trichoderma ghanense]|uniref:Uncharacterized protein n=1 Tax=Trichoderma ghanense TaxID=65468 RepID=A0ABY2H2V5_9HYPO
MALRADLRQGGGCAGGRRWQCGGRRSGRVSRWKQPGVMRDEAAAAVISPVRIRHCGGSLLVRSAQLNPLDRAGRDAGSAHASACKYLQVPAWRADMQRCTSPSSSRHAVFSDVIGGCSPANQRDSE